MHVPLQMDAEKPPFIASEMSKWVDEVLGTDFRDYRTGRVWRPAINLYEDAANYCLVVDLAGVDAQGLDLRVEKDFLVLSGDRPTPVPTQCELANDPPGGPHRLHLMEIDHGHFCRSFDVPADADVNTIEATYRNGYLWIRMPKKA